jgi:integrase
MATLTKRTVEAAKPAASVTYVWDDQLAGFALKVLPDGRRRYVVKYRVKGGRNARQRWFGLGTHGQVTCEQARARALQVLSAVARGEDPQAQLMAERTAPTVAELWARYEAEHLPRKKERSGAGDRQKARDHVLPALGRLKVDEVRRADIQRLHQKLSDRPYQANRVLALLSKMFNLAEAWGMRREHTNPCLHVQRFKESARQRYLAPPELRALAVALQELEASGAISASAAAAIKLLLLTGARVSEILSARWEWIDWPRRVLRLPDSKTGAKEIFLNDQSLLVLTGLIMIEGSSGNPHVIRARVHGQPITDLARPWNLVCARANLQGVRIHDLRHTAASVGVASGLNLPVIGRLLGHTQMQTTQRYAHVDIDPALVAANAIGAALSEMMNRAASESERA